MKFSILLLLFLTGCSSIGVDMNMQSHSTSMSINLNNGMILSNLGQPAYTTSNYNILISYHKDIDP